MIVMIHFYFFFPFSLFLLTVFFPHRVFIIHLLAQLHHQGAYCLTVALRDFSGHRALYEKTIYFAFFCILENVCFAFFLHFCLSRVLCLHYFCFCLCAFTYDHFLCLPCPVLALSPFYASGTLPSSVHCASIFV